MKNTIRASLLAVGVMLFGTAAYAQGTTTAQIHLSATVLSTDALTCSTTAAFGDITPGTAAVPSPLPTCTVTDNDALGATLTVYISTTAFTGTGTNMIPASALTLYASGSALGDGVTPHYADPTLTALSASFTGSSTGNVGLDVGTFPPDVSSYTTTLNLSLTAPVQTPADSYTGTLNVVLTPIT